MNVQGDFVLEDALAVGAGVVGGPAVTEHVFLHVATVE